MAKKAKKPTDEATDEATDEVIDEVIDEETEKQLTPDELIEQKRGEFERAKKDLVDTYEATFNALSENEQLMRWREYVSRSVQAGVFGYKGQAMDSDHVADNYKGEEFIPEPIWPTNA